MIYHHVISCFDLKMGRPFVGRSHGPIDITNCSERESSAYGVVLAETFGIAPDKSGLIVLQFATAADAKRQFKRIRKMLQCTGEFYRGTS